MLVKVVGVTTHTSPFWFLIHEFTKVPFTVAKHPTAALVGYKPLGKVNNTKVRPAVVLVLIEKLRVTAFPFL